MLAAFDRSVVTANRFVIAALLAIMTLLVFGNVVLRYGFGSSLPWVEEATRYMMIWTAYLGGGLAFRAGSHVAVEVLPCPSRCGSRSCSSPRSRTLARATPPSPGGSARPSSAPPSVSSTWRSRSAPR